MRNKWHKFVFCSLMSIIVIPVLAIWLSTNVNEKNVINSDDACKLWIEAMEKEDMEGAVRAATSIISDANISKDLNCPLYEFTLKTSENIGINKYYYRTKSFNAFDFQIWSSALFFKKIADHIEGQDPEAKAEAIYKLVSNQIRNGANGKHDWPIEIWERGTGSCDRQAWVCLAIAKQAELDALLLIFRNPDTGESPHTACIILGDSEQVFLLDTYTKKFTSCRISELKVPNSDLSLKLYPDSEIYKKSLPFCDFVYCESPQNFCIKNQALQNKLKAAVGNKRIPVFGTNQETTLERVEEKVKRSNGNKACPIAFWCYPVELLKQELTEYEKEAESQITAPPESDKTPIKGDPQSTR